MSLSAPDDALRRPDAAALADAATLPPGTRLAEFELVGVVGDGGFGVVYQAQDLSLGRRVALKEYMPSTLAARKGTQVSVRSPRHADTFAAGLRSFVNEAQLLARFDHPSLVKVYRFWEANGTAYMVMPYYEGTTLKQHLQERDTPPSQDWLLQLLEPLIDALAAMHAEHCWHRDIAPDNIILLAGSGRPLLLDFGAARRVITDLTQALTVILKPGYAPLEQYAEVPELRQGPWTDVYALCAVVHYAITGRTPPPAVGRMVNDSFAGLGDHADYSPDFLHAIERGLRVRPDERTPSMQALAADLGLRQAVDLEIDTDVDLSLAPTSGGGRDAIDLELAFDTVAPQPPPPRQRTLIEPHGSRAQAPSAPAPVAAPTPAAMAGAPPPAVAAHTVPADAVAGAGRRWMPVAAGVLVVLGVAAWYFSRDRAADAGTATTAAMAPQPAPATAGGPPAAGPAAAARRIAQEFDRIMAARQADWMVDASTDKPRLRVGRDRLSFKVTSNRDGYLYVLLYGPDDTLILLFPNSVAADNRVRAGQTLTLPGNAWLLDTADPPGPENFITIVSAHRRDYSALRPVADGWFQRLSVDAAGIDPLPGGRSVVAGSASCEGAGCDRYGSARFTVTVER